MIQINEGIPLAVGVFINLYVDKRRQFWNIFARGQETWHHLQKRFFNLMGHELNKSYKSHLFQ